LSKTPARLLSGIQTVKSIRDTGYKSTDYAIAELIDNAFDADADTVTLLLVEEPQEREVRRTVRVSEIWVLDDGSGMDEELTNLALSFGGSGHYDNRNGIGRFGMGLPQASVSQCKTTELWSWQRSSIENAHRTALDLQAMEASVQPELTVPWPTRPGEVGHDAVPQWVCDIYAQHHSPRMVSGVPVSSGTVVRWTNLDRLRWVKAASVVKHTTYLLGRIYRRFIAEQDKVINVVIAERDGSGTPEVISTESVIPNDPMYLSAPKCVDLGYWEKADADAPDPAERSSWIRVTDEAPFEEPVPPATFDLPIPSDPSRSATVTVTLSQVKAKARPEGVRNVGTVTHLGRHAKNNRGISMMRAGRELLQEQTLVTEATDRWWAIEVDFPPVLDELFGVTNNKQDTPYFTTALRTAIENGTAAPDKARQEALLDEGDPVSELYPLASHIHRLAKQMHSDVKKERRSHGRATSASPPATTVQQSKVNEERKKTSPTPGERKVIETGMTPEQVTPELEQTLLNQGVDEDEVKVVLNHYRQGVRVHFIERGQSQSPAFFWGDEILDDAQIYVNSDHEAFSSLIEPLRLSNEQIEALHADTAKKTLGRASDALSWLLQSYVRMELEVADDLQAAAQFKAVRETWGRHLREIVAHPLVAASVSEGLFDDLDDGEE
jgi:hypothetical protein